MENTKFQSWVTVAQIRGSMTSAAFPPVFLLGLTHPEVCLFKILCLKMLESTGKSVKQGMNNKAEITVNQ